MSISMWWLLALPALVPLGITLFNLVVWPRGSAGGGRAPTPHISVCVPARNEEAEIEGCVRSIMAQPGVHEVVVLDDGSQDATPEILKRLQAEFASLRVLSNPEGLPAGWVGKVHACHLLSGQAQGELLLFVDADTRLLPGGIARLLDLHSRLQASAVSVVPYQRAETAFEQLMMPLLHLTYTAWLPMPLVWLSSDPRFLAANGQVMLLSAAALREVGGFASIRSEIVDDMALLRRFKLKRRRVVFADGMQIAATRMYRSASELWSGFSKNAYEGIGATLVAMLFVLALYAAAFLLPYGLLLAAPWVPVLGAPALIGVGANLMLRGLLAWRFRHAAWSVLAHPFAVLLLGALLVNSRRLYLGDQISWRGRTYVGRGRGATA